MITHNEELESKPQKKGHNRQFQAELQVPEVVWEVVGVGLWVHPDSTWETLLRTGPLHMITALVSTVTGVQEPYRDTCIIHSKPPPPPKRMVKQAREHLLRPRWKRYLLIDAIEGGTQGFLSQHVSPGWWWDNFISLSILSTSEKVFLLFFTY